MKRVALLPGIILVIAAAAFAFWRFYEVSRVPTKEISTPSGAVKITDYSHTAAALDNGANRQDYVLAQTDQYIIYAFNFNNDSSFVIALYGNDLTQARRQAETALLKALNISQSELCRLEVAVNIADQPENRGTNYGLSFCPNALSF